MGARRRVRGSERRAPRRPESVKAVGYRRGLEGCPSSVESLGTPRRQKSPTTPLPSECREERRSALSQPYRLPSRRIDPGSEKNATGRSCMERARGAQTGNPVAPVPTTSTTIATAGHSCVPSRRAQSHRPNRTQSVAKSCAHVQQKNTREDAKRVFCGLSSNR